MSVSRLRMPRLRTPHLFLALAVLIAGVLGYVVASPQQQQPAASTRVDSPSKPAPSPSVPPPVYDVKHLVQPEREYLGITLNGAPKDMGPVEKWTSLVGVKPNIITIYESFEDQFAASEIRNIYQYGALPILRWEPYKLKLSGIAAGEQDAYVTKFATAVRALNLPIALTFGHEMNGGWYSWGTGSTTPAEYVAAWRHLHDLFAKAGATNVIWTWTPNVVNPVPSVALRPLYPGDEFVDWIGMDGYFTTKGQKTFSTLFQPTIKQIRAFSQKPMIIVETGSEAGPMRAQAINELFTAVANDKNLIGFIYFNQKGSGDWRIDSDSAALAKYRAKATTMPFGFTVH